MPDRRSRRSKPLFAATCVASLVSLAAVASAQPGQYAPPPYAPPTRYAPYAQPAPYTPPIWPQPYAPRPSTAPSYTPLNGSNDRGITADRAQSWAVFRLSGGAGLDFARNSFSRPSFDFDVATGARLALSRRFLAVFEVGYSFVSEPTAGGHFATLGAGLELYGNRWISLGWTPKLVVGAAWPGLGIGVRNTLNVPLLFHVVSLEVGHQYLRVDDLDKHELRAQIGVDLAAIVHFWAWTVATGR